MKKQAKVRSKLVKESLLDYEKLTENLKENTASAVKDLLNEAVRDTYNRILTENEDDEDELEYDEEEVEDTNVNDDDAEIDDTVEDETDDVESEDDEEEGSDDADVDTVEVETSGTDDDGTEWAEFEKYKVGDDEYDFSEADDEEVVKVYKLLKDDDQVVVKKNDGKVNIKDNETGAEYIIDIDDDEEALEDDDDSFIEIGDDNVNNEDDNMNESIIYELALNEYDSHVGYTDDYQKDDVMTNPGMSEPGKNVRDWDAGVPKGDAKPWSGYPGKKAKADKPFTAGKGKTVEEEEDFDMPMDECGFEMEEGTNVGGFVQQNSTSKSHIPNSNGRKARSASKNGKRVKGTTKPRYSLEDDQVSESIMRKANKIFVENRELKDALKKFRSVLKEAAVTNVNLGKIIKLISENATSQDEKMEIISRFGNEAKTIKDSERLYESISRELQKKGKMNINEEKQFSANGSKQINETTIYKSNDMLQSLDLMHRLCK